MRSLFIKYPIIFFVIKRLLTMVVLMFLFGFTLFALLELTPGDIVDNYVKLYLFNDSPTSTDNSNKITKKMIEQTKHELGLDLPFYMQYARWIEKVFVEKDLGTSLVGRAPVLFLIRNRMINSFILAFVSLCLLTIVSFALSLFLVKFNNTLIDNIVLILTSFLRAIPQVFLFIILQLFAALTGFFPITAYPSFSFSENPLRFFFSYGYHIFLPLLGIFLVGIGGTVRYVRATMLDQLGQPYITVLRSRGISEKRLRVSHAFKNTLNPYITGSADLLASLFSGSLILEVIFDYPGIGSMMYAAIQQEDINLVVSNMMFIGFLVLLGMMISDIVLAIIDPRIRYGKE